MAASGAMPSWTNNASVPPRVIAHPRKDAGISYKYKYTNTNTNANRNTNSNTNTNTTFQKRNTNKTYKPKYKISPPCPQGRSINASAPPRAIAHPRRGGGISEKYKY